MLKPVDVFNSWALNGKDEGMQKNHSIAVDSMIQMLIDNSNKKFSFIDAGCGNGWVVRKLSNFANCTHATGIDGAESMIAKARNIDEKGDYRLVVLPEFEMNEKFDVVHSMEFIYYLHDPAMMLNDIFSNWLNDEGLAVFGIDFYAEHKRSHNWPESLDVHMTLLSEEEWLSLWKDAGFIDIKSWRANPSDDFPGTLVISGRKP